MSLIRLDEQLNTQPNDEKVARIWLQKVDHLWLMKRYREAILAIEERVKADVKILRGEDSVHSPEFLKELEELGIDEKTEIARLHAVGENQIAHLKELIRAEE